jgi:chorismate synthase
MSSFENLYKINKFGESYSKSVDVIIDSYLSNINLNIENIQNQLNRIRP